MIKQLHPSASKPWFCFDGDDEEYYQCNNFDVLNCHTYNHNIYRRLEVKSKEELMVDAVNYFHAYFDNTKDAFDDDFSQVIIAKKNFDNYGKGEFYGGNYVVDNEYWEVIGTKADFIQCVEDMVNYSWNDKCEFRSYEMYKYLQVWKAQEEALKRKHGV